MLMQTKVGMRVFWIVKRSRGNDIFDFPFVYEIRSGKISVPKHRGVNVKIGTFENYVTVKGRERDVEHLFPSFETAKKEIVGRLSNRLARAKKELTQVRKLKETCKKKPRNA